MLQKTPARKYGKILRRGALYALVAEGICFVASYTAWYLVNNNRDYRKYLNDNYPTLLEYYYKLGETIDKNNRIRQIDYTYWRTDQKN